MKIPLVYNVRSLARRPVSSAMTALGVALVVGVFIAMLALANGFKMALVRTGSPDNVMVLRKGADSELSSGISRDNAAIIAALPEVAAAAAPASQPWRAMATARSPASRIAANRKKSSQRSA